MSGTSLREARASDAGAIARLHVEAWQWAYAGIMPGSLLASLEPAPASPRPTRAAGSGGR